ncbi:hypothetical protein H5410_021450, partial [Solanum commersonii]
NYSIRSCWYQTKIWINPNLPQPTEFKDRLISSCDYKYERLSQTKTIQLLGKTAKELKEGLLEDAESSYPTKLGDLMEKKFMFKILIKDSNINKKDNVYKVVNFTYDVALLKEYCHPDLQDSLNVSV